MISYAFVSVKKRRREKGMKISVDRKELSEE
jgi:hypothetical protein